MLIYEKTETEEFLKNTKSLRKHSSPCIHEWKDNWKLLCLPKWWWKWNLKICMHSSYSELSLALLLLTVSFQCRIEKVNAWLLALPQIHMMGCNANVMMFGRKKINTCTLDEVEARKANLQTNNTFLEEKMSIEKHLSVTLTSTNRRQ